ncbi:MAG: FAD-dependent thymidylate synthase [Candidatus Micrarchaeia archaeon]
MPEEFTDFEKSALSRYCTNVDGDVFVLINMPEVVKGTLFSRYSRSPKSLKRLLLDEFISGSEIRLEELHPQASSDTRLEGAISKADNFYERVLVEYGDDSVAELAGAHIALENISNLATKFIEDARIGISPLEKSSRYVYFNEKVNGNYKFYRDEYIMGTKYADEYISACNLLFDTYSALMPKMQQYFEERFPRDESTSGRAYESAIRAKVCDTLRGLLPASTLTNVGLFGNGRAFEYLITKSRASKLSEITHLGRKMHDELSKVFPVFLKRAYSKHGDEAVQFFGSSSYPSFVKELRPFGGQEPVFLADYDKDGTEKVIAAILYSGSAGVSMQKCIEIANSMTDDEKIKVLRDYVGNRTNRRHKPGRAFENTYYLFDITANFGAYRDLHRHRILTQERQLLTVAHGYDIPYEIDDAGYESEFREALENAARVFWSLHSLSPIHAQYVVPFAYKVRWYIRMNLREAFHLIELRSGRQGHRDYRRIAQDMYRKIKEVHPLLADTMQFVDMKEYDLERLEAEKRKDQKLAGICQGKEGQAPTSSDSACQET